MISLNDVLLAASNIPVDDPIVEIWGRGLQDGGRIIEYTGALPITIRANGDALLDYRIYGADGGVGVDTKNLVDFEAWLVREGVPYTKDGNNYTITGSLNKLHSNPYYFSDTDIYVSISGVMTIPIGSNIRIYIIKRDGTISGSVALGGNSNIRLTRNVLGAGIKFDYASIGSCTVDNLMLNLGHTALPYEPYGYKLPMMSQTQEAPVYIGENQLDSVEGVSDYVDKSSGKIVRMIGEYTFTGDESFNKYGNSDVFYTSTTIDPVGITTVNTITMRCDHPAFTAIENKDTRYWLNPEADNICCFLPGDRSQVFLRSTSNFTTATECKAYLKAQYDNGTPVKISYWLKTPVEKDPPVPLPEIPTIKGETVIDYDGEPKPSQMYVKYKGKAVQ